MTFLQKMTLYLACKCVPSSWASNALRYPKHSVLVFRESGMSPQMCRFYGRKVCRHENYLKGAQVALLEYLHSTRGLSFTDAEAISKHSPQFLHKLLEKVVDGKESSLARFLRYHPINEFEPFFESIGLEPSEYVRLLPRGFMFLSDDARLVENYHVLYGYGVPRNEIGRIYKEAREVFGYGDGVLYSKLRAFQGLGMTQLDVIKTVTSYPYLLSGGCDKDFGRVLGNLKSLDLDYGWVKRNVPEMRALNWRQIHGLLCLFVDLGCNKEELQSLINLHPRLLFDGSGSFTFSLIGFLVKLGFSGIEACPLLQQIPEVQLNEYVPNLKGVFHFVCKMEMDPADVEGLFQVHSVWLGSISLKNPRHRKKRVCAMIKENPQVLKKWARTPKTSRFLTKDEEVSRKQKIKFLKSLGFKEDSEKTKAALKVFRGKGDELRDRFNCFVKAGLDPEDVSRMVKASPKILNISKQAIRGKIDCLVNELGYPVSDLVRFPSFIGYATERIRVRHSMYVWLREQGIADPNLALSTFIGYSEKMFVEKFVNSHPKGPRVWEELRRKV